MKRGAFGRGLAVSVAGLRAGGAFAIDGALQRLRGDSGGDSPFMKREARRFVAAQRREAPADVCKSYTDEVIFAALLR